MRILLVDQGTPQWLQARCGKPTASKFGEIVTPTGKATTGKSRRTYQIELVAERLTGTATTHFVTAAMQRGVDLEPNARDWYSGASGNKVEQVGFVLSECGRWGCSPDGLTKKGGVEIKCPGRVNMLTMLLNKAPEDSYTMQIQGCMFVTGRTEWDFVLYSDEVGIPPVYWTIKADPKIQDALAEHLPAFCDELDEIEKTLRQVKPF